MKKLITTAGALALAVFAIFMVPAADNHKTPLRADSTFDHQADLTRPLHLKDMLGIQVYGRSGEEIGEIKNIIIGADGQVQRIIIQAKNSPTLAHSRLSKNR